MSEEANRGSMDGVMSKGYGTIPKLVMQHEDLSIEAKAIYAYLASFAGAGDTAYPSVSIMCKHLGISKDRFYRHRKALLDNDFIRITQHQNKGGWSNNIYTVVSMPSPQNKDTQNKDTQNTDTINNSIINNSINNNSINNIVVQVINYLNNKANTNYRASTNKTKTLIRSRINEGFILDDFKKVIDIKTEEWIDDKKMCKYLRPETLFGNKFESYLNQEYQNKEDKEIEELKIGYNY